MIRIACMALSKRIHAGRPTKDGKSFVSGGQDVTSDCLKAIMEYVGVGNSVTVHADGQPAFEIEIRSLSTGEAQS